MRRVIFYGRIASEAIRKLVTEYQVQVVLTAETLEFWMIQAFKDGQYDVLVVDEAAPKAGELSALVRKERGVPVVTVRSDDESDTVVASVVTATRWTPSRATIFVVVACIKGGVGKTTMAGALSEILSTEKKKRVLLVDDDPNQANSVSLFIGRSVPVMKVSDIARVAETLPPHITRVHDGLDILAIENYVGSGSGVTYKEAHSLWQAVSNLEYDFVVADTSPAMPMPENPDTWTNVHLASVFMINPSDNSEFHTVYVSPFTPDSWGWEGVERIRDILTRSELQRWMIPAVTAIDADSVVEHIPDWLLDKAWQDRLVVVPHNRRIREKKEALFEVKWFQNPLKPYRPIADRVMMLAEKRLNRSLGAGGGSRG